jgi:hypothetical protein
VKRLYLVLAAAGAMVPHIFLIQFFSAEGLHAGRFLTGLFSKGAVVGFSSDLLITSLVFWIAMIQQRRAGKGPGPGFFILLSLLNGLSCALPAYLYVREDSQN